MRLTTILSTAASVTVLLAGCGGGGGGSNTADTSTSSGTTPAATTPGTVPPAGTTTASQLTTIRGTAATGAPFGGATVSVIDKTGAVVGTGTTAANGSYTVSLANGATLPFVIEAARDDLTLVSVVPDANSQTINVTPITNLIASRLSPSGNPARLAAELRVNPSLLSSTTVSAKVNEIIALLQPLLTSTSTSANPLTSPFTADGTGIDRVLDTLLITITPSSATTANIEVAIKQQVADGVQPATVQFTNQTATVPPVAAPAPAALVPSGTTTLIADLVQRLNACYALPVADRVVTPEAFTAPASSIKAPACRTLFQGNDPATYLNNGDQIGGANRAKPFNGIFRNGATNVVFERGSYQFTTANGDIVIGYRTVDSAGGLLDQSLVTRLSPDDKKLHIIGNQYVYPGAVSAYHQLRTFPNQPAADHYSTGYTVSVPNNGQLSKVIVTSPKGKQISLVPSAGIDFLTIPKNNIPSSTNFIRIRGEFADGGNTANPADFESGLVYDADRPSNDEIASFAANSVWKLDYYLIGNTSVTPNATQYYRTLGRALTIPEMKQRGLAVLNSDVIADINARTVATGTVPLGNADEFIKLAWTVPFGSIAPTSLTAFGQGPVTSTNTTRIRFNDGISVNSSVRIGNIPCQPQSLNDDHCTVVGAKTVFANGTYFNGVQLVGTDAPGRNFAHFYATYKILP